MTDAYNSYVQATGATFDQTVGLLSLTEDEYENLESLFFHINGVSPMHHLFIFLLSYL